MPQATCIISFDCEGKWGRADKLDEQSAWWFTNARLTPAYQQIVHLLARYKIKATFAFVGAFTVSAEEFHANADRFTANPDQRVTAWIKPFTQDFAHGRVDGWLNPDALQIVASHSEHEIGAHGFTHAPLSELYISPEGFRHEMECLKILPVFQRDDLSIIYPRNRAGYLQILQDYGFIGYRKALKPDRMQLPGRFINLLDAVNVWQPAQVHASPNGLVQIPAGFVLNWRAGVRRKIPVFLTLRRWKHLLHDAIAHKKVLHLWTHPHNFVSGDRMFEVLESILRQLAAARDAGKIINLTQREYAREFHLAVPDRL